jgi:hypothetical protein
MSFTKRISLKFRFRSLRTSITIAGLILITLFPGCATLEKKPPPTMTGSFNGNSSDGRPVSAKFVQDENAVVGTGSLNGRRFALSSVASWYGPAVLVFEDGSRTEVQIIMSPDGRIMTIRGLGESLKLARTGYTAEPPTGPFAGVFADSGDPAIWLSLSQASGLLAGTGYVDGKPVAVTGSASSPEEARGVLLFSDGSKMGVRAVLSGDGGTLTIKGLGRPIELRRR